MVIILMLQVTDFDILMHHHDLIFRKLKSQIYDVFGSKVLKWIKASYHVAKGSNTPR